MVKEQLRKETEVLAVDLNVINQKGRGSEKGTEEGGEKDGVKKRCDC